MRRELRPAQGHLLAVGEPAVDDDRRKLSLVAESEVSPAAALEQRRIGAAGVELRPTHRLEEGEPAGMVEMGVTVEQDPDVADLEAELRDVGFDLRRGLDETAVDQNVPSGSRDQVGGDVRDADIVEISGDAERLDRLVPRAPLFGGLARRCRRPEREKRTQ